MLRVLSAHGVMRDIPWGKDKKLSEGYNRNWEHGRKTLPINIERRVLGKM
jgi:hypothetical protein